MKSLDEVILINEGSQSDGAAKQERSKWMKFLFVSSEFK